MTTSGKIWFIHSFSLPYPARRWPAFSIVPTDREPGTGYSYLDQFNRPIGLKTC